MTFSDILVGVFYTISQRLHDYLECNTQALLDQMFISSVMNVCSIKAQLM